ncbi:hypothetical protein KC349_g8997 [Hortaea werneckii]|nr:hypothetical protein KC349_g8997 [Hortaea werneckii]
MSNLAPQDPPFALRQTNVSQPSLIHSRPSQQSITASEDYYSISSGTGGSGGSSTYSGESGDARAAYAAGVGAPIRRYRTPPSRYRTPAQSGDQLPSHTGQEDEEPQVRRTPMRGQGRRRQSPAGIGEASTAAIAVPVLREGGIRRKPVPSTVMEGTEPGSPVSPAYIPSTGARSSVAQDISRERNAPTPGVDDTPYIRFALDQLTRDEEVRGSRTYQGLGSGMAGNYPYIVPETKGGQIPPPPPPVSRARAMRSFQQPRDQYRQPRPYASELPGDEIQQGQYRSRQYNDYETPALASAAAAGALPYDSEKKEQQEIFDDPPPRNPARLSTPPFGLRGQPSQHEQGREEPSVFMEVPNEGGYLTHLNFIPGTLRPFSLILFFCLVLAYTVCLVFCAAWSLTDNGLWDYGIIGDARYFVFQYLPTLLGVILLFWVIQIEVAVMRIAPFVAMASDNSKAREAGAQLSMHPKGFVLPYVGHFTAGLPLAGVFMVVAWLQIWTLPLLASSFNVYYTGSPETGRWRWIATQGAIWTVIVLYVLLLVGVILLMVWLKFGRRSTGLKWDPRSLADLVVLMERSNALEISADGEPARLGYWRTSDRPNETFHTYGIVDKSARRYDLEGGEIREKRTSERLSSPIAPPTSRFSEPYELESNEKRHSRENMLPRPGSSESSASKGQCALPWYLHVSMAALWAIIAIVLLLAFLIVSYLPSTRVSNAFAPTVPAPVNVDGFSATNFLFSFIPALLATLCLLVWLDFDYAYRRLQAFETLVKDEGESAEKSLLLSYVADLPVFVTINAGTNGQWQVAVLSFVSLIAATLPILGGGVFWAQFYIPDQTTRMAAHMTAYYALTVFCVLYALAYLLIFPSRRLRYAAHLMGSNSAVSFAEIIDLVHQSRILNDLSFHEPESKIQLVTRLLSAPPGTRISQNPEATQSKGSLADSLRGFGRARQYAAGGISPMDIPTYHLGSYVGRDGQEYMGIDRLRRD